MSNSQPRLDGTSPLRLTLFDPWVVAAAAMAAFWLVLPDLRWLEADIRKLILDQLSTGLLLVPAIGAVLQGVGRMASRRERFFWLLVAVSLGAWLAGEAVTFLFMNPQNVAVGAVIDALYFVYYLGLVLALDLQPHLTDSEVRSRPLRFLASGGRALFVTGLFLYFVWLPTTLGVEEYLSWVPSFSFYVVLDVYVIGRFLHAARQARGRGWSVPLALLAVAGAFVLSTDSMDFAWVASRFPESLPRATDICWYAPMVLIAVASRARRVLDGTDEGLDAGEHEHNLRGVPLLVYSLGFALIHLGFSLIRPVEGTLLRARVVLVMSALLLFGTLHLLQSSVIQRWVREQRRRRRQAEEHIRLLSRQDPLTGLLNRRALEEELARAIARTDRTGLVLGLMFIDVDGFKAVNDSFGHRVGDLVLREAAARLRACTREVDTLARYGGDEFVLVLEALGHRADAEIVGRRIVESFGSGFSSEGHPISLSVSVGVAVLADACQTPAQLFEAADRAMYSVKQAGGGGIEFACGVPGALSQSAAPGPARRGRSG